MARRDLDRYRAEGPDNTTRHILDAVRHVDLRDGSLLDIGGGIGVLHHELLEGVVARATHVEAAPAYVSQARAEAVRLGHGDRVQFVVADFVDVAADVESADLVTLDRVICCYPDYVSLLRRSADKARRYCALSYPHDRWYVRLGVGLQNLLRRFSGNRFRMFVHPTATIQTLLGELGFVRRSNRNTMLWQVTLYAREERPGSGFDTS